MDGAPQTVIPFYGTTGFQSQNLISDYAAIARGLVVSRQLSQVPLDKAEVPEDLVSLLQREHFLPNRRDAPNLSGGIVAFYGVMIAASWQQKTYSPSEPALFVTQAVVVVPEDYAKKATFQANIGDTGGWAEALSVAKLLIARHSLDVTLRAFEASSGDLYTVSLQFDSGHNRTGHVGGGGSFSNGSLPKGLGNLFNDAQWGSFEQAFTPMLDALQGKYLVQEQSAVGPAGAHLAQNPV